MGSDSSENKIMGRHILPAIAAAKLAGIDVPVASSNSPSLIRFSGKKNCILVNV